MSRHRSLRAGALDDRPLPGAASRDVPAVATITADVVDIVPAKLAPGNHVPTMTVTDATGSVSMIGVPVAVRSCTSARVSPAPRATDRRAWGR